MTRARHSSVALLLTALVLVPAGTAAAHDRLVGSDPEDGSTVEAPDQLELTFSGAIGDLGAQVAVTDADGRSVVEGSPEVEGTVVEQDLVDDLADGAYAVVWRVTSEDGHPISGELTFTVEAGEVDEGEGEGAGMDDGDGEVATQAVDEATAGGTSDPDDADVTADPDDVEGEGGLPLWGWALVVLAALGLLGLLARTWSRGRG